jgi:sigma-B regulation protein RsbU (phosphoserine phosphatase)
VDGIEGLELIERVKPDLIILDIVMPRLGGLDVLRRIRSQPKYFDLPVIVQTGNDSTESRDSMFSAGATDYVTKPLNLQEFQGRVTTHLKNLLLVKSLESQLDTIAREMKAAAELQRSMLPPQTTIDSIKEKYRVSINTHFDPCSTLGGDFFGVFPLNETSFAFYLCDFAGHGVGAALNTVRIHTVVGRLPPPQPDDPASYLEKLNADLCSSLTNRHYATLLFGIIDTSAGTFTYSSAGAPRPLAANGIEREWLESSGMPLGLIESARYDNRCIAFSPGSTIFLYSDAMTESMTTDGNMFGEEAVADLILSADTSNKDMRLKTIINCFYKKTVQPLDDDLTAILIEWPEI